MPELPSAFLERMQDLLGSEYQAYLDSFSEKRVYGLRVNTNKISVEKFLEISPFDLEPVPWTSNGFYYSAEEKPAKHPYYFAGLYYLQEPSAMTPAEILPVCPGDRILDVCAAPGGKSTALAAKLGGTGVLFSNDISNSRAQALLKNLELFGVKNAVISSEDPAKMQDHFPEYFDKILIDAPCSGEGMFRKEPAVIRSWIEHGNAFYVNLQKQIAAEALHMLKPGGIMVYSTCTFSPEEDEDMVLYMKHLCPGLKVLDVPGRYEGFAPGMPEKASESDPELEKCIRIFPHRCRGEGHFVALLQKPGTKEPEEERTREGKNGKGSEGKISQEAEAFLKLVHTDIGNASAQIRNDKIYAVPEAGVNLNGLRIMRSGLLLGEVKKNRFEPSQALAMALKAVEFENTVSFSVNDPRVLKYLKGETVMLEPDECSRVKDGWILVCTDGYPLGFAKNGHGTLKNKYLAGWRYQ